MQNQYDERSFRYADVGESYDKNPRINSSHLRITYSRIKQLSDALDFNSPIFDGMLKRTRSLGSAQAFICEIACADKNFIEQNIKPFCVGGLDVMLDTHYLDSMYFDRLEAYRARQKGLILPPSSPPPSNRSYFNKGRG